MVCRYFLHSVGWLFILLIRFFFNWVKACLFIGKIIWTVNPDFTKFILSFTIFPLREICQFQIIFSLVPIRERSLRVTWHEGYRGCIMNLKLLHLELSASTCLGQMSVITGRSLSMTYWGLETCIVVNLHITISQSYGNPLLIDLDIIF